MASLVAMNMKRKDAGVASHGSFVFLDPKRIKLQQDVEIQEMMEEEEPVLVVDASPANVHLTMFMPSLVLPAQGQEAAVHGSSVSTASGSKHSEPPPFRADQAAPMDVEADGRQCQALEQPQPQPQPHFFSGY